jgi:nucleotide-binding universal stress UspA family protein
MTGSIPYPKRNRVGSWTLRRVLCATDFSDNAAAALDAAVAVARAAQAKVLVLHVAPPAARSRPGGPWLPAPAGAGKARADLVEELAQCERRAVAAGVETEPVLREGDPVGEIVEEARRAGADLIVMGRHSRGAPDHWFVGSVAEGVARNAPCPVMVVKPFPRLRGRTPRHVVCALDLGQTSAATMAHAAALTNTLHADLLVLHVAGGPGTGRQAPAPCGATESAPGTVQEADASLAALIAGARLKGRVQQKVVVGTPHDEILGAGGEGGADLVVVGSHAGGILDRQFIGSTTLHLLRKADCDVLIVPAGVSGAEEQTGKWPSEESETPPPGSLGRA